MGTGDLSYEAIVNQNRLERETKLRESDRSWLKLAGLFGLKPGVNTFGSDPGNDIVLPKPAPAVAGNFTLEDHSVRVSVAGGVTVTRNGEKLSQKVLRSDADDAPDFLQLEDLTLLVIERGDRMLIRVWDQDYSAFQEFDGLKYYNYIPGFRVEARFVAYAKPKVLKIDDVIDITHEIPHQGCVLFRLGGRDHQLEAILGDDYMFLNFRDQTNGDSTYPGGRFLVAGLPKMGRVTVDFNDAYNPPCAYTDFATCPLPPIQNRLPLRIEAGEKLYREHSTHG
ncbi:MAG: DUF1684 domain-containing protein [Chloroflexota bacterium]